MILKSINAILLMSHARNVNSIICRGVFVQGVLLYVFNFYPQLSELLLPMDRRISEKVSTLVKSGVRRIQEMRRHLHSFIEEELFTGRVAPPMTDARYYPSSRTLLNAVQRACTSFRCTLLQHYTVSVRMSILLLRGVSAAEVTFSHVYDPLFNLHWLHIGRGIKFTVTVLT